MTFKSALLNSLWFSVDANITEEETEALIANNTTSLFVGNVRIRAADCWRSLANFFTPTDIDYRGNRYGTKDVAGIADTAFGAGEDRTVADRGARHVPKDFDAGHGTGECWRWRYEFLESWMLTGLSESSHPSRRVSCNASDDKHRQGKRTTGKSSRESDKSAQGKHRLLSKISNIFIQRTHFILVAFQKKTWLLFWLIVILVIIIILLVFVD